MAGYALILDAVSEDATNAQLDINDGTTYRALDPLGFAVADDDPQWASSADTEGARLASNRHQNGTTTIPLRVYGGTAAGLSTALKNLQQKMSKIFREGGTLKVTDPNAKVVVFDLLTASPNIAVTQRNASVNSTDVTLTFTRKPYGRLPAATGSLHTETTNKALVFTETGVPGDVPALGSLDITDAQGADQWAFIWGQRSRYYSSAATAALQYAASTRTALGGSSTGSGVGGLTTIQAAAMSSTWQAIMSTQATGGGAHLTHVGDYEVWARIYCPSTFAGHDVTTQVAWEWAVGDYRNPTRNDPFYLPPTDAYVLVPLGSVHIPLGTTRWEGRLIGRSPGNWGESIQVHWLFLVPSAEGSGVATAVQATNTPSTFLGRDEFASSTGGLNAMAAATGGNWATSGETTDFSVNGTTDTADRSVTTDTNFQNGRLALLGSAIGATVAQVDIKLSSGGTGIAAYLGVVARGTDTNNYFNAAIRGSSSRKELWVAAFSAGSIVFERTLPLPSFTLDAWWTLRTLVDAGGRYLVWLVPQASSLGAPVLGGYHSFLATGGALATGKAGFRDLGSSVAGARSYDNFQSFAPVVDAAVFASQSATVTSQSVTRKDSSGSFSQPLSRYEGDYLRVPPAGQENRTTEFIVIPSRGLPGVMADPAIDDVSARLTTTGRVLVVGE